MGPQARTRKLALGGVKMETIKQTQKMYEVHQNDAGDLVTALLTGEEWRGQAVPEHILAISLSPATDAENKPLPSPNYLLAVGVVFVTME